MPEPPPNVHQYDYALPHVEHVPEPVLLDMLVQYRQAAEELERVAGASARTWRHRLLDAAATIEDELARREMPGSDPITR